MKYKRHVIQVIRLRRAPELNFRNVKASKLQFEAKKRISERLFFAFSRVRIEWKNFFLFHEPQPFEFSKELRNFFSSVNDRKISKDGIGLGLRLKLKAFRDLFLGELL